jgi:hypothetical protein
MAVKVTIITLFLYALDFLLSVLAPLSNCLYVADPLNSSMLSNPTEVEFFHSRQSPESECHLPFWVTWPSWIIYGQRKMHFE